MPRKKQGQSNGVEQQREPSGVKVKKKTSSSVATVCNEATGKTANFKGTLCKTKTVQATTMPNSAQNGALQLPVTTPKKGKNLTPKSTEVSAINFTDNFSNFECKNLENSNNYQTPDENAKHDLESSSLSEVVNVIATSDANFSNRLSKSPQDSDSCGKADILKNVDNSEIVYPVSSETKTPGISVITLCNTVRESTEPSDSKPQSKVNVSLTSSDVVINRDDKDQADASLQMSGVSPVVSKSGYISDIHQLNYRISTTITETKSSIVLSNNLKKSSPTTSIFKDQQECRLPSSVYGSPASNIERVLTGLNLEDSKQSHISDALTPEPHDILQNVLTEKVASKKSTAVSKNCIESYVTSSPSASSRTVGQICKDSSGNAGRMVSDWLSKDISSNSLDHQPKLHIPNSLSSDDSNSLQHVSEMDKPTKFPKITSPQILEQHISKIISQNAAIVETSDPLWSKRYLRQSSQNSDTETKKSGGTSNKIRRLSSERLTPGLGADGGQSKLQSALMGTLDPHRQNPSFLLCKVENIGEKCFSMPTVSYSNVTVNVTSLPKMQTSSTEEELKGSAIKSLLSLKQGRYSQKKSTFCLNKETYIQHPQNPEGSIIKDLLLKTKCQTKCSEVDVDSRKPLFTTTFSNTLGNLSEEIYQCMSCGSKYSEQKLLDAHRTVCEGTNTHLTASAAAATTTNGSKPSFLVNGFFGSKLCSSENMPILNPLVLSSSIEDLLKNSSNSPKNSDERVGHILKTQLLSPLSSRKSPPLKKRKISEPIISADKPREDTMSKTAAICSPFEEVSVTPQRCRSQSVHLFGGEVQIHDGAKTKRMKIVTSLSEAISLTALNSSINTKSPGTDFNSTKEENRPFQIVVTIAQPVHNSGGTVTHVPVWKPSSSLSSLVTVTLANGMASSLSSGKEVSTSQVVSVVSTLSSCQVSAIPFLNGTTSKKSENIPVINTVHNSLTKNMIVETQSNSSVHSQFASFEGNTPPLTEFPKVFSSVSSNSYVPHCVLEKLCISSNALNNMECKSSEFTSESDIDKTCENAFSNSHPSNEVPASPFIKAMDKLKPGAPTILFTPCSPTHPLNDKDALGNTKEEMSDKQKFLSPIRPTSLPLKKKPFTMVGSTLISPDTPRPKKSCMQLYINGHAYTYLGLKCSTRSTYCCIYRPQPMYVLQDTDPKLSMYSNWQVVPAKEELCGMTPGQMLSFYNSKQPSLSLGSITTAKLGEPLSFTHSSYWTFRSQKRNISESDEDFKHQSQKDLTLVIPEVVTNQPVDCSQKKVGKCYSSDESGLPSENILVLCSDRRVDSLSENTSSLDVEVSVSDAEDNNTQDEDDDDDDDKTEVNTDSSQSLPPKRVKIFEGGFKSNEDYTYVRGRGRGKYVCEECGIRCKKPSMLKKHIRTHTDLRPYKCRHCSFAFKTKGNLTKHMKSKAHHKKCTELGIIPVPTTSDDSQIDEEALAKQEQLKNKNFIFSDGEDVDDDDEDDDDFDDSDAIDEEYESDSSSMATSAKNVSLVNGQSIESDSKENAVNDMDASNVNQDSPSQCSVEQEAARSLLHLSSMSESSQWSSSAAELCSVPSGVTEMLSVTSSDKSETFHTEVSTAVLMSNEISPVNAKRSSEQSLLVPEEPIGHRPRSYSADVPFGGAREHLTRQQQTTGGSYKVSGSAAAKETSEFCVRDASTRRYSISVAREARRPCIVQSPLWATEKSTQVETLEQPMDLRIPRGGNVSRGKCFLTSFSKAHLRAVNPTEEAVSMLNPDLYISDTYSSKQLSVLPPQSEYTTSTDSSFSIGSSLQDQSQLIGNSSFSQPRHYYPTEDATESCFASRMDGDLADDRQSPEIAELSVCSPVSPTSPEENFLIHENISVPNSPDGTQGISKSHNEFMNPGTSSNLEEGKCICRICNKIFAKAGQLRIHVNIHYFERPFRCDNCGVSFRTKGHLQKHKRSVSHYNKVNMNMTFGTPSVDNPRPFKCADCKIAFRIHGHLAKHLRSKMHIMKLECLGKLPFGMYAEMERSGVSLNEIDTTDCNNSLESLQVMAQKLYQRDPRRMRWHSPSHDPPTTDHEIAKCPPQLATVADHLLPVPDQLSVALSSPSAIGIPVPSIINLNPSGNIESEVKHEPSDPANFQTSTTLVGSEIQMPPVSHYAADQSVTVTSQHVTRSVDGGEGDATVSLHRSDTCHICGRMFKSAKFLQVHLYCDHSSWNITSGEVSAKCSISTSNPRATVIAQDVVCDLCRRHFPNQNSLQQHLLTHAQPRPFVCEVCDAGFTSSSSLVSHLATHQPSDVRTSE